MDYTLHQLQVFLKVAQKQSVTKAAEELYLTQPAVSIQLKNFQQQFDVPLTEVVGRKLYITDFGKEIALAAEKILDEVHAINFRNQAYKGQLAGRLKISVVSTGKYVMPYFLTDFLKRNQSVELLMDVTNKARVIESLERNEVDFSLISVFPENLSLDSEALMKNKLFVVANTEVRYNTGQYDWSIFESLPLIYREEGSGTRFTMEKYIIDNALPVRKKMELTSNEAVKQAVLAGLGCSIMPLIGIKNELSNGELQIIPVKGFSLESTWQIVWLKKKKLAPLAESFLSYVRKEKDRIVRERFEWYESY